MLKLYYVPGTCALCPHIVLREAGVSFTAEKVNPKDKTTESGQDYNAINLKGYVPALVMNNGQLLTEVAVIVQYIADLVPNKKLAPLVGTPERYRLQEWLNFVSSEIHKGFSPLFNPRVSDETKTVFNPLPLREKQHPLSPSGRGQGRGGWVRKKRGRGSNVQGGSTSSPCAEMVATHERGPLALACVAGLHGAHRRTPSGEGRDGRRRTLGFKRSW